MGVPLQHAPREAIHELTHVDLELPAHMDGYNQRHRLRGTKRTTDGSEREYLP